MVLPPPRLPGAGLSGRRPSTHFYNPCTSCSLWRTWRTLLCKSLCPCVIQLQCVAPIDVHQHALLSLRAAEAALMAPCPTSSDRIVIDDAVRLARERGPSLLGT